LFYLLPDLGFKISCRSQQCTYVFQWFSEPAAIGFCNGDNVFTTRYELTR